MKELGKRWLNRMAVRSALFRTIKHRLVDLQGRVEARNAAARLPAGVDRAALMPDFLCIGAQKSATTWLHDVLAVHPDVYVPAKRKEVGFFGHQEHLGLDWYLEHFVDGLGRIKGESFPGYGPMAEAHVAALRRRLPDLRIILLLRDPIDRAWSHARMGLLRDGGYAFAEVDAETWRQRVTSPGCLLHGGYARILRQWRAHFPPEHLLVGYYDTVVADPRRQLREVLEFIGADPARYPDWEAVAARSNAVESHPIPPELERAIAASVIDGLRELAVELPGPETARWLARAERLLEEKG